MYVEVPIIVSQWVSFTLEPSALSFKLTLSFSSFSLSLSLSPSAGCQKLSFYQRRAMLSSFPPQPQIFMLNLYPRGKVFTRLIFLSRLLLIFYFFIDGAIYTHIFTFHTLHVNFYSLIFFSLIHSHRRLKIEKYV